MLSFLFLQNIWGVDLETFESSPANQNLKERESEGKDIYFVTVSHPTQDFRYTVFCRAYNSFGSRTISLSRSKISQDRTEAWRSVGCFEEDIGWLYVSVDY